jgi:TetR/AcrR family transcriptional regulator
MTSPGQATPAPTPASAGTRRDQREQSRRRIVAAAVEVFGDLGFEGGSTRAVAARAGVKQGLVTYHFPTKVRLWQAAADEVFGTVREAHLEQMRAAGAGGVPSAARAVVVEYVRLAAHHPELFRLLVEEGKHDDERMVWLVETHLRPLYELFTAMAGAIGLEDAVLPHAFYALVGAASVMFAVAPECRRLTGVDPRDPAVVDRHAAFVADLLVPAPAPGKTGTSGS